MSQVVNERAVRVRSITEGSALEEVGTVDTTPVSWEPMKFEQATYENFHVEYATVDGNMVVHFFVHPNAIKLWPEAAVEHWWQNVFASTLSDVAQDYFKATTPRIMAKYTMETASWWFKAQGYGHLLDSVGFLRAFFERLDGSLPTVDGRPPACAVARASS